MPRIITIATAAVVALTGAASAQNYPWKPEKPITLIVPWAAGGSTDQVSRITAAEIEKALGQKVVVVNQGGASGSIGTRNAMQAPPDGYTWTAGTASASAHGQVMIRTATARRMASRGPRPTIQPPAKVSRAALWTTGT